MVVAAGHLVVLEFVDEPGPTDIEPLDPHPAPCHLLVPLVEPDAPSRAKLPQPSTMARSSFFGRYDRSRHNDRSPGSHLASAASSSALTAPVVFRLANLGQCRPSSSRGPGRTTTAAA